MAKEKWQPWDDECERCGSTAEVFTTCDVGFCHCGDKARCTDCGLNGCISVDDQDENAIAYVEWSDDGEEAFHISLKLDVNSLKDWPADCIAALFDGIAKVQTATASPPSPDNNQEKP